MILCNHSLVSRPSRQPVYMYMCVHVWPWSSVSTLLRHGSLSSHSLTHSLSLIPILPLSLSSSSPPVHLNNITRLVLSHNKISILPPEIVELRNLEYLNLFNNHLEVRLCMGYTYMYSCTCAKSIHDTLIYMCLVPTCTCVYNHTSTCTCTCSYEATRV